MKMKTIAVIGAGPAGLAAALSALKEGTHVVVLEHMDLPGRKLLLTGNGQCNLSNTEVGYRHYHGDRELIERILSGYSFEEAVAFWKTLGVETVVDHYRHEECGYLYPKDHSSETVLKALLTEISHLGGKLVTGCEIREIRREECFIICSDKEEVTANAVILATGSNAYPKTGSDSSIYPVLKSFGIELKPWLPALVALKSNSPELKDLKGLRADASVTILDKTSGESFRTPDGEVQFREHYISGLPVLQLSRYASIGLKEGHEIRCLVRLIRANNKDGRLPLEQIELNITGTEGFDHAVTCSGGIPVNEVNRETLESSRVPGLYFAGEMIDIDGDCGGFNLHFAFASGMLAGRNASK